MISKQSRWGGGGVAFQISTLHIIVLCIPALYSTPVLPRWCLCRGICGYFLRLAGVMVHQRISSGRALKHQKAKLT